MEKYRRHCAIYEKYLGSFAQSERATGKGGKNFAAFFIFRFASTRLSNETRKELFPREKFRNFPARNTLFPPTFSFLSKRSETRLDGENGSVDSRSADVFQFHTRAPPSFSPTWRESVTGSNEKFTIQTTTLLVPPSFFPSFPHRSKSRTAPDVLPTVLSYVATYIHTVTSNAVFERLFFLRPSHVFAISVSTKFLSRLATSLFTRNERSSERAG